MGVLGLWDILLTIAQRISIDKLSGKILAIDASIWIVRMASFTEADKKLKSLLDRIEIMRKNNILPIFVFDGVPPAIKSKTLEDRKRRRVADQVDVKKKAEIQLLKKLRNPEQNFNVERKSETQMKEINGMLQTLKNIEKQQLTIQLIQKLKLQSDILTKKYSLILENDQEILREEGVLDVQDFDVLDLEEKQIMISHLEEVRWRKMREGGIRRNSQSHTLTQEQKIKKDIQIIQKKSIIREMQDHLYRKMIKNHVRQENGYQIIQGIYNGKKVIQKKKIKDPKEDQYKLKKGKMKNDFDSIMIGCKQKCDKINENQQEEDLPDYFLGEFCQKSSSLSTTLKKSITLENQSQYNFHSTQPKQGNIWEKNKKRNKYSSSQSEGRQEEKEQFEEREEKLEQFQGLQINWQRSKNDEILNLAGEDQLYQNKDNLRQFISNEALEYANSSEDNIQLQNYLTLLGIPFVIAVGQAEAQCANLETHGIVDGVITEDSDVFLFGAKNVYRGLFQGNIKYYSFKQVEAKLKFNQEKFIIFALFMGSDYTDGIKGIGIVNTMEILKVFDTFQKLIEFQKWAKRADILLNLEEQTQSITEHVSAIQRQFYEFHQKFKNNWYIHDNFPNKNVINAYLKAETISKQKLSSMKQKQHFASKKIMKDKLEILFRQNMSMSSQQQAHHMKILGIPFKREHQTTLNTFCDLTTFAQIRSKRLLKSLANLDS